MAIACDPETIRDITPGFRIIMERAIANDWLLVIRHAIYEEGQPTANASKFLQESQELATALSTKEGVAPQIISFYASLIQHSDEQQLAESLRRLTPDSKTQVDDASPTTADSKKPSALDILKKKAAEKNKESSLLSEDNRLYFNYYSKILGKI